MNEKPRVSNPDRLSGVRYNLYATLLDGFQNMLDARSIWAEYWGNSDIPKLTEDEFVEQQRKDFIDRINRVPFDRIPADRGTAFNEVVDCLILGQKSEKMIIESDRQAGTINAFYNGRNYTFPTSVSREFAAYYKGSVPQVYTHAVLPTIYGDVMLYGYIDELMPASVHDIKTTGKYSAGKFKNHWQHIVYPFCLNQNGNKVADFEYNILLINERRDGASYETFTEYYAYDADADIPRLTRHVESIIEFLEENRGIISDKKIFNLHESNQ
ncbi:hypothetical protein Barb6XT_02346 [Bacteroidales bacterium Barb6XT]|nr:hypothetical protein Barb6XT_02346 [Bacteroidales bacterium Barb6XT]